MVRDATTHRTRTATTGNRTAAIPHATSASRSGSDSINHEQPPKEVNRFRIKARDKTASAPSPGDDNGSDLDLDALHASLIALGAPHVARAELAQLCRGGGACGFGEVLRFFVAHAVGRGAARDARRAIAGAMAARTDGLRLGERSGSDSAYTQWYEANRRLCAAEKVVESVQREVDSAHAGLSELEHETDRLRAELRRTRLTNALLSVLEKKEKIRKRRVEEIGGMLRALHDGVQKSINTHISEEKPSNSLSLDAPTLPRQKLLRVEHVRDTLAMLQGYHVALSRSAKPDSTQRDAAASQSELERRLLKAVARTRRRPEDDDEVQTIFKHCLDIARRRAGRKLQYVSPLPREVRVEREDLDALAGEVAEKERRLEETHHRIVALRTSCAEALRLLNVFRDSTVPILKESLDEDIRATEGHVHVLRKSIETECADIAPSAPPLLSYQARLEQVQTEIITEHELRRFLAATALNAPADPTPSMDKLAKFRETQGRVEEALRKVLGRKVEKNRLGDGIVKDVKVLVEEIDIVADVL